MTYLTLPPEVAKLETRLGLAPGDLDGPDRDRALAALEDATTLVLAEVSEALGSMWARNAPRVVELVVLTAARRGYENPRGINQETLGEHTVGLSESTGVYLTARELVQVQRAASKRKGYTGSIRTPSAYRNREAPMTAYVRVTGSRPVPFLDVRQVL